MSQQMGGRLHRHMMQYLHIEQGADDFLFRPHHRHVAASPLLRPAFALLLAAALSLVPAAARGLKDYQHTGSDGAWRTSGQIGLPKGIYVRQADGPGRLWLALYGNELG